MGRDDREQGDQDDAFTVTWGEGVSHSRSVTTSDGAATVTTSHGESRMEGCGHHKDYRTVRLAWAQTTDENSGKLRERVLTELARLLADAPEAVDLDGAAVRGKDFLFTLEVPRARLAKTIGTAGTSERPASGARCSRTDRPPPMLGGGGLPVSHPSGFLMVAGISPRSRELPGRQNRSADPPEPAPCWFIFS